MHLSEYQRSIARAQARWYFFFNEYAWENADLFPAFGLRGLFTRIALVVGLLIGMLLGVGHFNPHYFENHQMVMDSLIVTDMVLLYAMIVITYNRDRREYRETKKKALEAFYLAHPYDYVLL